MNFNGKAESLPTSKRIQVKHFLNKEKKWQKKFTTCPFQHQQKNSDLVTNKTKFKENKQLT